MTYSGRSVEERIEKTSGYTAIQNSGVQPDFDLIKELKQLFDLDDEQARPPRIPG
jgi:hypothetical protein